MLARRRAGGRRGRRPGAGGSRARGRRPRRRAPGRPGRQGGDDRRVLLADQLEVGDAAAARAAGDARLVVERVERAAQLGVASGVEQRLVEALVVVHEGRELAVALLAVVARRGCGRRSRAGARRRRRSRARRRARPRRTRSPRGPRRGRSARPARAAAAPSSPRRRGRRRAARPRAGRAPRARASG